jgi:GntR family transcriptional regulator
VICRQNRYFADDEPVQLGTTFIPLHVAGTSPRLRSRALGRGSLYALSQLED